MEILRVPNSIKISLLVYCMFYAATSAYSYDSSGGDRTKNLLARVEFQGPGTSGGSSLFPWTDSTKAQYVEKLRAVLLSMPLDVAELPQIDKIVISNTDCANNNVQKISLPQHETNSKLDAKIDEAINKASDGLYYLFCGLDNADWVPETRTVHISGPIAVAIVTGRPEGDAEFFPEVILHELTHAWEIADGPADQIPGKTRRFYDFRYKKRASAYKDKLESLTGGQEADLKEANRHIELFIEDQKRSPEQRRWKDFDEFSAWQFDQIATYVHARNSKVRANIPVIYNELNLPARQGQGTGRCWVINGVSACDSVDSHPMDLPTEYLASLSELMWADPDLARKQYSAQEIEWVQKNIFKGRSSPPFQYQRNIAHPPINGSEKSEKIKEIVNDWEQAIVPEQPKTTQQAVVANNDADTLVQFHKGIADLVITTQKVAQDVKSLTEKNREQARSHYQEWVDLTSKTLQAIGRVESGINGSGDTISRIKICDQLFAYETADIADSLKKIYGPDFIAPISSSMNIDLINMQREMTENTIGISKVMAACTGQ